MEELAALRRMYEPTTIFVCGAPLTTALQAHHEYEYISRKYGAHKIVTEAFSLILLLE